MAADADSQTRTNSTQQHMAQLWTADPCKTCSCLNLLLELL